MTRVGSSIVGALLLVTLVAGPAAAAAPVRFVDSGSFEFVWEQCDAFDLVGTYTFAESDLVLTSRDGLMREIVNNTAHWELRRSDTDAVVAVGEGHGQLHAPLDGLPDGTWLGLRYRFVFESGTVVTGVGRISFDSNGDVIFDAGSHPLELGLVDFCELV